MAGLLLARWLTVDDYAIYTITMILMGALTVLTKGGVHLAFTAILGRHWPDMERASAAVTAALAARRLVSLLILPPFLGLAAFLLIRSNAGAVLTGCLLLALVGFWWADMRTRVVDQILFLAKQTTRVQMLDTALGLARVIAICGLYVVGWLTALGAVVLGVIVAAVRIGPVAVWIGRLLPANRVQALPDDTREIRAAVIRQMPVELFYVFQAQIVLFSLSLFGSTVDISGYGALGRIAQLLLPLQAFSYAFCIPRFVQGTHRIIPRLIGLVALCSVPGLMLVVVAMLSPAVLLWLVGANYADLGEELVVCTLATALSSTAGIAWNLVAHRGWNHWAWLQIPVGLVWCTVAPQFLDLGSILGALWLQAGFSFGLIFAMFIDIASAYRRGSFSV